MQVHQFSQVTIRTALHSKRKGPGRHKPGNEGRYKSSLTLDRIIISLIAESLNNLLAPSALRTLLFRVPVEI